MKSGFGVIFHFETRSCFCFVHADVAFAFVCFKQVGSDVEVVFFPLDCVVLLVFLDIPVNKFELCLQLLNSKSHTNGLRTQKETGSLF